MPIVFHPDMTMLLDRIKNVHGYRYDNVQVIQQWNNTFDTTQWNRQLSYNVFGLNFDVLIEY